MSIKQRLLSYLERNSPNRIHGGELQRLSMEAGYSAQNAGRRLRELENEGKIEVEYVKNQAVYKFKSI